jgi:hypothetical protein
MDPTAGSLLAVNSQVSVWAANHWLHYYADQDFKNIPKGQFLNGLNNGLFIVLDAEVDTPSITNKQPLAAWIPGHAIIVIVVVVDVIACCRCHNRHHLSSASSS